MSCCARLGRFEEAERALFESRKYYALHLGLPSEHHAAYIASGYIQDEDELFGDNDLRQNPWLHFIFGLAYRPSQPKDYIGDTEAAKRRTAMEVWSGFFSDPTSIKAVLACLLFENSQHAGSANLIESLLLIQRRFERESPVRVEVAWPYLILGECYGRATLNKGRSGRGRVRVLWSCALQLIRKSMIGPSGPPVD